MTRKHYNQAVVVLQEAYPNLAERKKAAIAFMAFFKADNPRFDEHKFLMALEK